MYGLRDVIRGLQDSSLIVRKGVSFYSNVTYQVFGGNFGDYVVDEDWDNLIILDACRYDLFAECNTLSGDLRSFHSRSCATGSFVRQNFGDGPYLDTVYVSGNPNPADHQNVRDTDFAAIGEVWDSGWDDDLHTVPPETMVKRTIEAHKKHPNKRLISHFLQPHYPWIGPDGREFIAEHGVIWDWAENEHVWQKLANGTYEKQQIWELYRENLEVTLPHVADLIEALDGKTVVTSDHGNAFGEFGVYGHPEQMYIPQLTKVPWLEIPCEERKRIVPADSSEQFTDDNVTKEQLRDLGYV